MDGGRKRRRRRRSRKRTRNSHDPRVIDDHDDHDDDDEHSSTVVGDHRGDDGGASTIVVRDAISPFRNDDGINVAAFSGASSPSAAVEEKGNVYNEGGIADKEGGAATAASGGGGEGKRSRSGGRKRKRRARSLGGGMGDDGEEATAATSTTMTTTTTTSMTDQDRMHHWMMERVIVAPFTSPLIMSIERQVTIYEMEEKRRDEEQRRGGGGTTEESTVGREMSSSAEEVKRRMRKRKRTTASSAGVEILSLAGSKLLPPQGDALSVATSHVDLSSSLVTMPPKHPVSPPRYGIPFIRSTMEASLPFSSSSSRESLETIVDGAVCTLVRRSHRFRSPSSSSREKDAFVVKRFRRRRRRNMIVGGTKQDRDVGKSSSATNSEVKRDSCNDKSNPTSSASSADVHNHWLLGDNLLSAGYFLGSGEDHHRPMMTYPRGIVRHHPNSVIDDDDKDDNDIDRRRVRPSSQSLRGCPNMAPGIHCLHPNTLTSFARSSPFMRFLHATICDDALLREMLVNTILLVPVVPKLTTTETSSDPLSSSPSSEFHRGNYFQLCGPPLTMISKKFDGATNRRNIRGKSLVSTATTAQAKYEVHRDESIGRHKLERWDPNKSIPRGKLFYCEFHTKHVGLSPRHLLNQDERQHRAANEVEGPTRHPLSLAGRQRTNSLSSINDVNVKLLNAMVGLWPADKLKDPGLAGVINSSNKRRGRWRRLRESGIAMCQELRTRHRRCDYARLLERHCPLPINVRGTTSPKTNDPLSSTSVAAADDDIGAALACHVTAHHTPVENVGFFIEAVLKTAFPHSFWGSRHNFHQTVRTMRMFTKLGRTEHFPEKAIVNGIRVLDMTWLVRRHHHNHHHRSAKRDDYQVQSNRLCRRDKLSLSDHDAATVLTRNVMRWLYRQFIIPLLRTTFYITETEFTGSKVLYYRRPVWSRIKCLSMENLLKLRQYREISGDKVRKVLSKHNVGCPPAPLRILPKKTGIRAIAMLSKSCAVKDHRGEISSSTTTMRAGNGKEIGADDAAKPRRKKNLIPSPNKILQSTFNALKYEHKKKPLLFGAGALGLTQFFPSFCLFTKALKSQRFEGLGFPPPATKCQLNEGGGIAGEGGRRTLYFASADIKHCYDTINQKRLYEIMRSVIEEDVYLTKNTYVLHSKDNDMRCRWKKSTFPPEHFSRLVGTSDDFAGKYFNSIFVDGVYCSTERKETIKGLLRDHIFGQVVVANGNGDQRYLLQTEGIPQGSILSSMLCNIYFGNIEGILLDGVFDKKTSCVIKGSTSSDCDTLVVRSKHDLHLLVRIVDDFLLISTNKTASARFLKNLNNGIPSLGVKINSEKSRANYSISMENTSTGKMEAVKVCQNLFPWCGLLIDTSTCEISLDNNRFRGSHATDTVVIHRAGNEGLNLKKKMKDFVRPRCSQKLLFSSCINGIDMVRLNFYQTFSLCAIKLIHYMNEYDSGMASLTHEHFIYVSVIDTIRYAYLLIMSKIKYGNEMAPKFLHEKDGMTFQLAWRDALWLGRHAFIRVFKKSGARYAQLCSLFSESSSPPNMKKLLKVTKWARRMFPLER
ncbi:hypothetical protein ACHAXA_011159 [Cyclostephanos tholiformis]|uniref:Telomerase reverse transcriptase n=1 Tax=Cyclostephanos tholiformis TaxID=382380 RepID=A0ABD3R605_9STRA